MISIIAPSVRDYRWKDFFNNFSSNKTDFEIVVCGPCPPQDLGPKFRAIQTNVKATQCIEIGARQSKGEYLFFMADDETTTPGILDVLLERRLSYPEDLVILSPRFQQLGVSFPLEVHHFPSPVPGTDTPIVPVGMFISRKDWNAIGGIDRNFVKGFWDLDVAMRCWAMGGKVVIVPDVFINEVLPDLPHIAAANARASHHLDMPYLLSLWTDGSVGPHPGILRSSRSKQFEPFTDDGILEKDQSTPDEHKGVCQSFDAELREYINKSKQK